MFYKNVLLSKVWRPRADKGVGWIGRLGLIRIHF